MMYVPSLALTQPRAAAPGVGQQFYADPGSKTYASDLYAALTRQQWSDIMALQGPLQTQLVEFATDPNAVSEAMTRAQENVTGSFERQGAATQRRLRGLGLTLDADEQAAATRSLDLAKGLASVGAQNSARDRVRARQQSILGNPAPDLGSLG